jgi:molecular chaperone DnaK
VETSLADLRKVNENGTADEIKAATDKLEQASYKLAEALYQKTGAAAGANGAQNGASANGNGTTDHDTTAPAGEDVIDAEFKEAK